MNSLSMSAVHNTNHYMTIIAQFTQTEMMKQNRKHVDTFVFQTILTKGLEVSAEPN